MASAKRQLPLQLQKLPADHLQKVRDHVQGLLAAGLQEIPDLNKLDELLAANLQPDGEGFAVGQSVQIQGLTGAVEFNGLIGKILRLDESSGRYVVEVVKYNDDKLKEPAREQKAFKGANLVAYNGDMPASPKVSAARAEREKEKERRSSEKQEMKEPPKVGDFTVGDRVRVGGLNGSLDLNGQIAVVFGLDKPTGRYLVEFENGQGQKKLQGKNLTGMGVATGALAAKARMFAQMSGS